MVEVILVERFKASNGHTFGTKAEAEKAEEQWRKANVFDLEADIAKLTATGQNSLKHITRSEKNRQHSMYPLLYVLNAKHGSQYYLATTVDQVPAVHFEILKFNHACEYFFTPADNAIVNEIIRTENHLAAIAIVQANSAARAQYETVDIESIHIVP